MRQDLIEKHREINVDHHWWAETYNIFRAKMSKLYGVEVKIINFSGFSNQGDGACFTTEWVNLPDLIEKLGWQDRYPEWMFYEEPHGVKVYESNSRDSHSGVMQLEIFVNDNPHFEGSDADAIGKAAWEAYFRMRDESARALEKELLSFFRNEADSLYRELEAEYEYLTSDEVVWDTIVANGLHEEDEDETL